MLDDIDDTHGNEMIHVHFGNEVNLNLVHLVLLSGVARDSVLCNVTSRGRDVQVTECEEARYIPCVDSDHPSPNTIYSRQLKVHLLFHFRNISLSTLSLHDNDLGQNATVADDDQD